jgi:RNA polymerase sigma factor (TIGR02999 family)
VSDVTKILGQIESGDPSAAEQLLPLVYDELRKLAAAKLALEKPGQTLQATALVHEAYLRLVGNDDDLQWNSRGHFFAAASQAMRRILVESARRKSGPQRGGELRRQDAELDQLASPNSPEELLAIDEALSALGHEEPKIAKLVELRYFAGLTLDEAAAAISVSSRSARRYWAYAKAWLHHALRDSDEE